MMRTQAQSKRFRGLAWDDEPEEYIVKLKRRLEAHDYPIELDFLTERDRFLRELEKRGPWDFVVLDLVDVRSKSEPDHEAGIKLAKTVRAKYPYLPIVFLTNHRETLLEAIGQQISGAPILPLFKHNDLSRTVIELSEFLGRYDFSKVFIIYGADRTADGLSDLVRREIFAHGGTPIWVEPENARGILIHDLLEKMKQCWAFVAICTPDDEANDSTYQPRQNVLFEMGLAFGLSGTTDRLVVIQKYGHEKAEQAELPTDLSGKLNLRFVKDSQEVVARMIDSLRSAGVKLIPNESDD